MKQIYKAIKFIIKYGRIFKVLISTGEYFIEECKKEGLITDDIINEN